MAKTPTKAQLDKKIAALREAERVVRELDYLSFDDILAKLAEAGHPAKVTDKDNTYAMSCAGVTARSTAGGKNLVTNWGNAARRQLRKLAHAA